MMNNGSGGKIEGGRGGEIFLKPVEKFEEAFMSCLSSLTKEDTLTNVDKDEIKVDVEMGIHNMIETARSMESYFLKKRLEIAAQKPELLIKDEINELKHEMFRKDELLKKHYEKINHWQSILSDSQVAVQLTPGKQQVGPGGNNPNISHHPGGLVQGGPMSQTGPMSQGPMSQGPMSQGPMSQGPMSQGPMSQGPMTPMSQGPMTPTGGGRPNTPGTGRPQTPGGPRMQSDQNQRTCKKGRPKGSFKKSSIITEKKAEIEISSQSNTTPNKVRKLKTKKTETDLKAVVLKSKTTRKKDTADGSGEKKKQKTKKVSD